MKVKKLEIRYNLSGSTAYNVFFDVSFTLTKKLFQEMWDTAGVTEREMILQVVDNSKPDDRDAEYKELGILVLEQLKRLTGKTFRAFNTKGHPTRNLKLIINLLKDGRELNDILAVIDHKTKKWYGKADMRQYLRPITLFNPTKFEAYLNEVEK